MIKTHSTSDPDNIDQTLSIIFADYDPLTCLSPEKRNSIRSLLAPQMPSLTNRLIRLAFQSFSDAAPTKLRLLALEVIRKIRNTSRAELKLASDCTFNQLVTSFDQEGLTRRGYNGFSSALCISYDVDRLVGYDYLDEIIDLLARYNLKATFHMLTHWEYEIDWNKLENYQKANHEIGLHGTRHDIALGYRSREAIRREISSALAVIPFSIYSYRAPALCMSEQLLAVISEFGFLCDSSMPMSSMYYKSVESCYPYLCNGYKIWELPITMQDSSLFLDLMLSEEMALEKMVRSIENIVKMGGVNILNLHPYILRVQTDFHENLLAFISRMDDVFICTQKELCDYIRQVS